jgi:hypothetical protein
MKHSIFRSATMWCRHLFSVIYKNNNFISDGNLVKLQHFP